MCFTFRYISLTKVKDVKLFNNLTTLTVYLFELEIVQVSKNNEKNILKIKSFLTETN